MRFGPHTQETKDKIRATKIGALNGMFGKPAWNRGRKMPPLSAEARQKVSKGLKGKKKTEEHRKNISRGRTGIQFSAEHRRNIRKAHREGKFNVGAKSHLWKGGITPINQMIRTSAPYKEWRKRVFERDDYICQACGQRGGKLNADHELPFSLYPDLRFEVLNGRTLCETCHRKTATWGEGAKHYDVVA